MRHDMNYNPFAKNYRLNMFYRTVGDWNSMGLFDYALAGIPFLIKLGMHLTDGKPKQKGLHHIFRGLTVPFAVVKFCMYVGFSPAILGAWFIKEYAKKEIDKHAVSPYTEVLNQLMVKRPAKKGEKQQDIPSVPLSEIKSFNDGKLRKYSIRVVDNQLIITRFYRNKAIAIIDMDRANIIKMQHLLGEVSGSRFEYFRTQVGKNIFDYAASQVVTNASKAQASSHVHRMYKMLVDSKVADEKSADSSFARIHKDIRKVIAKEVIAAEGYDEKSCNKFFKSFTPEEREEATANFISNTP